jgi:hypothetical protein
MFPKCPWFCFSQDLHDGLLKLSSLLLLVFQDDQGSPGNCVQLVLFVSDFGVLWLQTWNMQTSAQQSLSGPKGQVHALAVSEDGLLFAGTQVFSPL